MIKSYLIVLFLLPLFLQAQQSRTFKIIGHSEYYDNRKLTVSLGVLPLSYNDCMIATSKTDTVYNPNTLVQNGKFELFGTLRYPHPLIVSYYDAEKNYGNSSYFYYIEGGDVRISVNDLAKNKFLGTSINSLSQREYQDLKKLYSNVVDSLTGRISDMQAKQKLMHAYIAAHPNSYVALWDLVFDYSYTRNDSIRKSILENLQLFSPLVKTSNTYQALLKSLNKDLDLAVGRQFPEIALRPCISIQGAAKENKFILIDFWASWCKACLEELPDLKKVYTGYKEKKFTIIGISIDKKEEDWQKAIQKFTLDWPQYLDVNGQEAKELNITSYPSNFLLDDKGVIIKKDVSPEELKDFLEKN